MEYHQHQWLPHREAGATAVQELALTLADGIGYVEAAIERGLLIDDLGTAPIPDIPNHKASPDLGQATGLFRQHQGQPEADSGRKRPRDQNHLHQAHHGAGCGSFR